jgi:Pentapeptide repeats (8 copies)
MKFLSSRLSVAVVAAILGASVVTLSSGALTKNSPVRATTFYACEANSGGAVSTISALSSLRCKKGFTKVSWNATGPTGARGPAGAQGTPGSAGAQGAIGPTGPNAQSCTMYYPGADLAGCTIEASAVNAINLAGANFAGATIDELPNHSGAIEANGGNFSALRLGTGVITFAANVPGANFQFADISNVHVEGDFTGVNFSAANLQNDDFTGAMVDDVNFANANLLGDTNLALNGTDMFANTVCPDGSKSQEDQGTCFGHT